MTKADLYTEARRFWNLGFGILWLHPRSKRPVGTGWTKGPRKDWTDLGTEFQPNYNVGVRTGRPSLILGRGYLACIDVDVVRPEFEKAALARLDRLVGAQRLPTVLSGSGNGSRHLYCVTPEPFKMITVEKHPGDWEIVVYSDGRQMVLPPSIHPDTGKPYRWALPFERASELPRMSFTIPAEKEKKPKEKDLGELDGFRVRPVELDWLPISKEVRTGILTGEGVLDRSGYLLKASAALISAGLDRDEVLSVLTDPDTFIGECAYEHAQTTSRKRAADWVYRYTLKKVTAERSPETVFGKGPAPSPARRLTASEREAQDSEIEEEMSWQDELVRGQGGAPAKLIQNVVLIITNAVGPAVIRRDLFAYRDSYSCETPWGGKKGEIVCDDDVSEIRFWLSQTYGFEPPANTVSDALAVIARKNAFDPVRDRLDGLPAWDTVPRLDTWLAEHFEAQGDAEYLAQVFRKWMVAMVMRVYRPGAKFDWMPIFEGRQGIGKSSFGRLLVGDRYFLDWLPNLSDKDSALGLQGMWGVELGELSQFRRNELENIKAFITRPVDKMRPPYGRRLIESPRRCVFFGTTNRETYLTDDTGNRRFKPVEVGNLDFKALTRDRDQLFAEAKDLFERGIEEETTLDLTGDARIFELKIQEQKMVLDDSFSMEESMLDFVEKVVEKRVEFNLQKFRLLELFEGVGALAKWKPETRNLIFAAKMLKKIGGRAKFIKGRRFWEMPVSKPENEVPPTMDFY